MIARWVLSGAMLCMSANAAPQTPSDPTNIVPLRNDLLVVPGPRLDDLEPAVIDQLRDAQHAVSDAAASTSAKDLADRYGALARVYHAYEFFDSADAAYANAVRLAPRDPRWLHLLGYLYEQTGRLQDAAEKFVAARRIRSDDRTLAVHLGDVYLGLNRLSDARDEFQSVIDVFPAVARRGLGEVALREGRFSDAVRDFQDVLDRVPQAGAVQYSLAMAYRGLGRMDEARAHLERRNANGVRAVDPLVDDLSSLVRGERALVMLGRRAYDAGQYQSAADAFRKALVVAPSSVAAHVNLGSALSQLGNIKGALDEFSTALSLDGANADAHAGLGLLLVRQRRDADALAHLQAAFASAPEDAGLSAALIGVLVRLGRADEAIAALTKARAFRPDEEDVTVGLSILLADRGRYRDAIVLLEEAYTRFPERAATATTLARLLASSPDAALRNGQRALEIATATSTSDPSPVHTETIAIALAELGRCGEALEMIRRGATEASRAKDAQETARLRAEAKKYESAACRP